MVEEQRIYRIKMKSDFDIEKLIEKGQIVNELDYARALSADRELRLLSKNDPYFKDIRAKVRNLIEDYEALHWNNPDSITDEQVLENDKYEKIAEAERSFLQNRKTEIRKKLKKFGLTQEDLASLLGHKNKSHMSELINGIKPFMLRDLVIINRLLQIDMDILVPVFLSIEEQTRIKHTIQTLNKPKLKLRSDDLALC